MSDPTRLEAASYKSASPATIGALHDAIKSRMQPIAAAFWTLLTKGGTERAPTIVDGWLPPITGATDERFPYVMVRPQSGIDSVQQAVQDAQATFEIHIGTYNDADDGWKDVLQVIDAIRLDLGGAPTINKTAFEQTGPLTWELLAPVDPTTSTRPQWLGIVTTIWTFPRPRRVEARNAMED
jgi:hypothetical protein